MKSSLAVFAPLSSESVHVQEQAIEIDEKDGNIGTAANEDGLQREVWSVARRNRAAAEETNFFGEDRGFLLTLDEQMKAVIYARERRRPRNN